MLSSQTCFLTRKELLARQFTFPGFPEGGKFRISRKQADAELDAKIDKLYEAWTQGQLDLKINVHQEVSLDQISKSDLSERETLTRDITSDLVEIKPIIKREQIGTEVNYLSQDLATKSGINDSESDISDEGIMMMIFVLFDRSVHALAAADKEEIESVIKWMYQPNATYLIDPTDDEAKPYPVPTRFVPFSFQHCCQVLGYTDFENMRDTLTLGAIDYFTEIVETKMYPASDEGRKPARPVAPRFHGYNVAILDFLLKAKEKYDITPPSQPAWVNNGAITRRN